MLRPPRPERNRPPALHIDGKRGDCMRTIEYRRLFPLFAVMLIGGCALGPNYKRPALSTPEDYRFATTHSTSSIGDLPWWEVFKDPVLQDLIRVALTNNYDIKQALARVEQARQQVTVARSPML